MEIMLLNVFSLCFLVHSRYGPVACVIQDCHWNHVVTWHPAWLDSSFWCIPYFWCLHLEQLVLHLKEFEFKLPQGRLFLLKKHCHSWSLVEIQQKCAHVSVDWSQRGHESFRAGQSFLNSRSTILLHKTFPNAYNWLMLKFHNQNDVWSQISHHTNNGIEGNQILYFSWELNCHLVHDLGLDIGWDQGMI